MVCMYLMNPVSAQKTVWKADDLNRHEVETLHDIFTLTSGWNNASNDDATIQFSRNALAGPGGAWWPVYLNGTELNVQNWNTQSLHTIPVSINQLDSVVIIESPMLYKGTFTEKGGIFLYSSRAERGVHAQGNMVFGNRSGDPGPFVYTEYATRNIERLGPFADAQLSFRSENYGIQAGFKHFVHAITDVFQYRRLTPFEFGEGTHRHEKIRSTSIFANGDISTDIFYHEVQAGYSESTDFLFTEIYGTEIPIDQKFGFIALSGLAKMNENVALNYKFSYNSNNTKEYPNKEDRWLRWNQQVTAGKTSISHHFENGSQQVGFEANFFGLEDEESANRTLNMQLYKAFHSINYRLGSGLQAYSNFSTIKAKKLAIKMNLGFNYQTRSISSFYLDASYSQRLPEEDNSLWFWMENKGFGADTLADYQLSDLPTRVKFLQTKLGWKATISEQFNFDIYMVWSRNIDEYIMNYKLEPNGSRIESGEFDFINNLEASFLSIPLKISSEILPSLHQSLTYTWTHQLSGNNTLFDMMPNHKFSSNLKWKPVDSFLIWTRFQAQSATNWALAEPIDGLEVRANFNQSEFYSSRTAALFQWDLGIKKYFWNHRVAFSLDMKNINNQNYRNHPVGPRNAFTAFLGMHIDMP